MFAIIRQINARRSAAILGRPPREPDFQCQYRRKPADANGQMGIPEHRYGWTKNKRSPLVRRTRLRTLRRNTISGRRRATFSASSRLFDLNGETNRVNKKQSSAIIAADVRRFSYLINTDEVFGTHRARRLKE